MAHSVNIFPVSVMYSPPDDGIHWSTDGFVFGKSKVKLTSRKKKSRKRTMVFKNTLSFASMVGSK